MEALKHDPFLQAQKLAGSTNEYRIRVGDFACPTVERRKTVIVEDVDRRDKVYR
jgi:hypothetical protein